MSAPHDARNVANAFIERAKEEDKPLTPLQIQKLIYFANAWMLVEHDRPLIDEEFEVWKYGPVIPSVYYSLSRFRGDPVREPIPLHHDQERDFDDKEQDVINRVFHFYGRMSGPQLSFMTHLPETPWAQARKRGMRFISNDLVRKYYTDLLESQRGRQG